MFRIPIRGGRILKTGIAVFLTAWICEWLGWPPVFAVITAIVTIEPTVADSIKKGFVRFPASAIGSFYTVTFVSLFGHAPITYTLSAVFTIATTYKLNLHAGLLVATLTAVAMVDVVHSNFLVAFTIRLGTTTIGLLVSTAVNMFILPPDYSKEIDTKLNVLQQKMLTLFHETYTFIVARNEQSDEAIVKQLRTIEHEIVTTTSFIHFQEQDFLHPLVSDDVYPLVEREQQLNTLKQLHHHLEQITQHSSNTLRWSDEERETLQDVFEALQNAFDSDRHVETLERALERVTATLFNYQRAEQFTDELAILYEVRAIVQCTLDELS